MVCDVILTTIIGIGIAAGAYMGITFVRAEKVTLDLTTKRTYKAEILHSRNLYLVRIPIK